MVGEGDGNVGDGVPSATAPKSWLRSLISGSGGVWATGMPPVQWATEAGPARFLSGQPAGGPNRRSSPELDGERRERPLWRRLSCTVAPDWIRLPGTDEQRICQGSFATRRGAQDVIAPAWARRGRTVRLSLPQGQRRCVDEAGARRAAPVTSPALRGTPLPNAADPLRLLVSRFLRCLLSVRSTRGSAAG